MVWKLIKNEFIDSKQKFMPILGMIVTASVLVSFTIKFRFNGNGEFFLVMIMLLLMALGIAIIVLSFIAFIDLLYTSLYNKNGYKMFTLPVTTWQIVIAKISVYFLWSMVIAIVSFLSFVMIGTVAFAGTEFIPYLQQLLKFIADNLELRVIAVFILDAFTANILTISTMLFVGSIVHSHYIQNYRGIKMFLGYVILSILIGQLIGVLGGTGNILFNFMYNGTLIDSIESLESVANNLDGVINITTNVEALKHLALMAVLNSSLAGLLLFGTVWFWDHKLEIID